MSTESKKRFRLSSKTKRFLNNIPTIFFSFLVLFFILFPFYWMVNSSFKDSTELFSFPPTWFPKNFTLEHYRWSFNNQRFVRSFINSSQIAIMTTAIATPISAIAAYSLARFPIPRKKALIGALVATQMIPGVLIVIPLFLTFSQLGLTNSYWGLALGYSTFVFPFAFLQLRAFFVNFPLELEDAAMIDGCSQLGAFLRITIPLSIPGIVTVALFSILIAWNDLLFALILTSDINSVTVAVQLHQLATSQFAGTNWGAIIAQAVIMTLPVVIIFVFLQKFLVKGLSAGALKG